MAVKHNSFIIIYYTRATFFNSFKSSSGPQWTDPRLSNSYCTLGSCNAYNRWCNISVSICQSYKLQCTSMVYMTTLWLQHYKFYDYKIQNFFLVAVLFVVYLSSLRAWWWLEGVETCRPEVVDYNKTVVFDCHLYVLYCH
jgi:hypothetical protein